MKNKKIIFPLLVSTISLPFVNLISCGKSPDRICFNTCDWEEIVQVCGLVESKEWNEKMFCKHFFIDGEPETVDIIEPSIPSSFDDFVGQWRTIKVNGSDHLVNILDCNKDTIYSEFDDETKATLTFQFRNLLSGNDRNGLLFHWGEASSNLAYWSSELHNVMQDHVFNMIIANETSLQSGIKNVVRKVCQEQQQTVNDFEPVEGNEKIFIPVLSNYFSHESINSTPNDIFSDKEKTLYCGEGNQYKYYLNLIGNQPIFDGNKQPINYECFAIHDLVDSISSFYYFATPVTKDTLNAWCIALSENGTAGKLQFSEVISNLCIAPCFCI